MIVDNGYDTEAIYIDVSEDHLGLLHWNKKRPPRGATMLGVIHRYPGDAGALIRLKTGVLVQGNCGTLKKLPQAEVEAAFKNPRWFR